VLAYLRRQISNMKISDMKISDTRAGAPAPHDYKKSALKMN
jgi:hypothetical protein